MISAGPSCGCFQARYCLGSGRASRWSLCRLAIACGGSRRLNSCDVSKVGGSSKDCWGWGWVQVLQKTTCSACIKILESCISNLDDRNGMIQWPWILAHIQVASQLPVWREQMCILLPKRGEMMQFFKRRRVSMDCWNAVQSICGWPE